MSLCSHKEFSFRPLPSAFFSTKLQLYRAVTAQFILWLFKKTRLELPHLPVQIFMTCQFGCKNAFSSLKVILRFFEYFQTFLWKIDLWLEAISIKIPFVQGHPLHTLCGFRVLPLGSVCDLTAPISVYNIWSQMYF